MPDIYDAEHVLIGAWWAACCVEDLYPIESSVDAADIRESFFDPYEPTGARVWSSKEAALADPSIQRDIATGSYSEATASRLGLPWPVLYRG